MFDTIVQGTRHTLDFAQQCGARKFLLISSGAVYGKQPSDMTHIPEDYLGDPDCTDPRSAYGNGKRAAEFLCTLYHDKYRLEAKIARCFAFVGPYLPLDTHFAIGNFIRDGLKGGPIRIESDGTAFRSYLYAADLALWLWTILIRGESCRPYNVGSDDDLTIAQLAKIVAKIVDPEMEIQLAKQPTPQEPIQRYVPDTQRAFLELGLRKKVDLDDSIKRTINWNRLVLS